MEIMAHAIRKGNRQAAALQSASLIRERLSFGLWVLGGFSSCIKIWSLDACLLAHGECLCLKVRKAELVCKNRVVFHLILPGEEESFSLPVFLTWCLIVLDMLAAE